MPEHDEPICWLVIAPLPPAEVARIANREWKREAPFSVDPPPWQVLAGTGAHAALVSRLPGGEGTDRPLAEHASRAAKDVPVYSLWLDPERTAIFEWRGGREVGTSPGDPVAFARSLGITVEGSAPAQVHRLALVEGATVTDVRAALGPVVDEGWLRVESSPKGVLITAVDGAIGTQAWDVAEVLTKATVYLVQRWPARDVFEVTVLQGSSELGVLRLPPLLDDTQSLVDIKGARSPAAIARALGIAPALVGLG